MKLFNESIAQLKELILSFQNGRTLQEDESWPDEGKNQLIFRSDMAYELGGDTLPAISGVLLTEDKSLVPNNEVYLLGEDLSEIKDDTPYARIALVRVKDTKELDATEQYKMIRKIEYSRYHLNPKGFMMRISALNRREAVRVSKSAIEDGLSFSKVGASFVQEYLKNPAVEAVKLIFITDKDFSYDKLSAIMDKSEKITKTLDHLLQKVNMDCKACSLKDVCAEVETLYKNEVADKK